MNVRQARRVVGVLTLALLAWAGWWLVSGVRSVPKTMKPDYSSAPASCPVKARTLMISRHSLNSYCPDI